MLFLRLPKERRRIEGVAHADAFRLRKADAFERNGVFRRQEHVDIREHVL